MVELLQHLQFVIDHVLVAADILLEDDFDRNFALGGFRLANNAVCPRTQRSTEFVLCPSTS